MALEQSGRSGNVAIDLYFDDTDSWRLVLDGPAFSLWLTPRLSELTARAALENRGVEFLLGELHGLPVYLVPLEQRALIRVLPGLKNKGGLTLFLNEAETDDLYRAFASCADR